MNGFVTSVTVFAFIILVTCIVGLMIFTPLEHRLLFDSGAQTLTGFRVIGAGSLIVALIGLSIIAGRTIRSWRR